MKNRDLNDCDHTKAISEQTHIHKGATKISKIDDDKVMPPHKA